MCACAAGLVVAACDTATAPPGPVQVQAVIVSHAAPPRLLPPVESSHPVQCDVVYELLGPDARIRWLDAVFNFHFGAARTGIDEVIQVSGEDLGRSWEEVRIEGRAAIGSQWRFVAPVPFSVTAEMAYAVEGQPGARVARSRFSCGPEPGPEDGAPRISAVVTSPAVPIRPGTQVRVSYSASSGVGLWETAIHVTGAWRQVIRIPEGFNRETGGEVVLTVPADALAGQPVSVAVSTVDAGLRTAFISLETAPVQ